MPNYQLLGNTAAYAFSDAAAANACIAMFELNKASKEQQLLFSNKKNYPKEYDKLVQNEVPHFGTLGINSIFTGTSHPDSSDRFEIKCLKEARKNGVYTFSFIDHWNNFKLRFNGLSNEELPDEIWVVDEQARTLAQKEGLPFNKLKVKGNPYHYYLTNCWTSAFEDKQYLTGLNIPKGYYYILFAPDPFSIRGISNQTGFTEAEALTTLLDTIQLYPHIFLIVKMHPLQPEQVLKQVLDMHPEIPHMLIKEANVPELIKASDLVVGFHSNLLLDAKALNKNVVRYFPGNNNADLFANCGQLDAPCKTSLDLRNQIASFIHE
jgi:hypothetical protein